MNHLLNTSKVINQTKCGELFPNTETATLSRHLNAVKAEKERWAVEECCAGRLRFKNQSAILLNRFILLTSKLQSWKRKCVVRHHSFCQVSASGVLVVVSGFSQTSLNPKKTQQKPGLSQSGLVWWKKILNSQRENVCFSPLMANSGCSEPSPPFCPCPLCSVSPDSPHLRL